MSRFVVLLIVVLLSLFDGAEARIGGGRTSGSRGLRGFGTRSYQTAPQHNYQQPNYAMPQQPLRSESRPYISDPSRQSGGFMRSFMGGLAGGFIGSMLFRGLGHAGMGGPGAGGVGLLEILLLAALIYWIFRLMSTRKEGVAGNNGEMSHYEKLRSVEPGPYAPTWQSQQNAEVSAAEKLKTYDSNFDLARFKDERMDDFMKLQAAWNYRDLTNIAHLVDSNLRVQLEKDIAELKSKHRINRIENIAVRGTELIEAWQEYGKEYATLRFRANLTDYTIDEVSGNLIEGDKVQPVKFEEDWTFVRSVGESSFESKNSWKLSAIEA